MNRPRASGSRIPGYPVKSFVVRLWQGPEGFRAEVLILSSGQNKTFARLELLLNFLRNQADWNPEPGD